MLAMRLAPMGLDTLLPALFRRLADRGLDYAVLRSCTGLPYTKTGSDIDLIIRPSDRLACLRLLVELAGEHGWSPIQLMDRPYLLVVTLAETNGWSAAFPDVLHLDLFTQGSWYGAAFLEADCALAQRRGYGPEQVQVVDPVDEVIHVIVHDLLARGFCRLDRPRPVVSRVLGRAGERERLLARLRELFGRAWTERCLRVAFGGGRLSRMERWALRARVIARRGVKSLYPDAGVWLGMVGAGLRQWRHRPGALIGVEAPTGAIPESHAGALVRWLGTFGKLNHGFADERLDRVTTSGNGADDRLQRAYDGAWGRPAALRARMRRLLRRGWMIFYPMSDRTESLLGDTDIVLQAVDGDACRSLVDALATRCRRQWGHRYPSVTAGDCAGPQCCSVPNTSRVPASRSVDPFFTGSRTDRF